jgi:hypothetical protein
MGDMGDIGEACKFFSLEKTDLGYCFWLPDFKSNKNFETGFAESFVESLSKPLLLVKLLVLLSISLKLAGAVPALLGGEGQSLVPANNAFNLFVSEFGVDPRNCNPTCLGDKDIGVLRDCSGDDGVKGLCDGLLSLETGDVGDLIPIDEDVDGLSL